MHLHRKGPTRNILPDCLPLLSRIRYNRRFEGARHHFRTAGYERYFTDEDGTSYWHILDPATGYPAESDLVSVTIISESGVLADALSTAVFVMGLDEGSEYWRSNGSFDMLLMTQDGEIYLSEGIKDSFTLEDAFSDREIHVIR